MVFDAEFSETCEKEDGSCLFQNRFTIHCYSCGCILIQGFINGVTSAKRETKQRTMLCNCFITIYPHTYTDGPVWHFVGLGLCQE